MSTSKPRLVRLTAILTQLQSKRLLTAREIAERHQISIRTVYRDIRALEQSGVPIVTEEGRGYRLMEGYQLPPVMFTEEEANALLTAQQIIGNNPDQSLIEQYQRAIDKVKAVLEYQQKDKSALLGERMEIRTKRKEKKSSRYLVQIQLAITNYQLLTIDYTSLQNKQTSREIESFALIQTQQGNWILIAYCRLRSEFRVFRLDCIQNIKPSYESFEPHPFTLKEYLKEARKKWELENNWQKDLTPDIPLTPPSFIFESNQKTITMKKVKMEGFQVIGIKVRTANDGSAAKDIPQLWQRFMQEQVASKILNKVSEEILCLYTNYEGDHTEPYDTILGCRVHSLDNIPEGMIGQAFEGGDYVPFVSKGDLINGALYDSWLEIWKANLDRKYTVDFEVHGIKAMNPNDGEVEIFVAVK